MLSKKNIVKVFVTLSLLVALTGGTGVVADAFGLNLMGQAHACNSQGSSGGGC